jgi:murein L,D-transpeptidase YcbB/YkuD
MRRRATICREALALVLCLGLAHSALGYPAATAETSPASADVLPAGETQADAQDGGAADIDAEPLAREPATAGASGDDGKAALDSPAVGEGDVWQSSVAEPAAFVEALGAIPAFSERLLREFYWQRDYQPAWSPRRAEAMLALAEAGVEHGLEPEDFHASRLREQIAALESETGDAASVRRWRADVWLSDSLLRYLHHLQYGKLNPREINPDWIFVDSIDARALREEMHAVLAAADLRRAVAEILPDAPFYEQLKTAYGRYRAIAESASAANGWSTIPGGANLKIGMRDGRVAAIRARFEGLDGYRFPPTAEEDIYDKPLYEAVREFQARSGLAQDGVIGPRTLAAMNTPLEEGLAAMRANLERMRWLYHDLPADYLLVDVAAFNLELVRNHQPVWTTRVVVGTGEDQTPMFRDEMEHLVFNPTWSVPRSIQKKMRGVPSSYKVIDRRTGRRVYPSNPTNTRYRLVQPPGPRNALGRVKFMFPNGHAIYLHDTPSRHLFARSRRSYSHGCVRVENPLDLAQEVLNEPAWDRAAIDRVVKRGRTRHVTLDEHLPVLLYYLTARADEQGRVGFRQDLYGRDHVLFAAMEGSADAARLVFSDEVKKPADEVMPEMDVVAATSAQSVDAGESPEATSAAPPSLPAAPRADQAAPQPSAPSGVQPVASSTQPLPSSADAWWGLSMPLAESSGAGAASRVIGLRESAQSNPRARTPLPDSSTP